MSLNMANRSAAVKASVNAIVSGVVIDNSIPQTNAQGVDVCQDKQGLNSQECN